ncbi:uncharacterized protein EV422DRAFT_566416 [Fimicolochytrium jonesii]|uniref:uncharacterized protein n=1 Tax=Fimicolochytrium jonesii TaxID=1396493 RepID=UPI0022FE8A19|nr:uncharacterized protein EV422DRAFT_566416 [Fimicolochytrium jonesii]KAI8821989.1 hypothetical protein EV422DRAFT_566416 [Fimicolochytrium jonesii]
MSDIRTPSPPLSARSMASLPRSEIADEEHLLRHANMKLCTSIYPYTADMNDELSFDEGQVIRVVRQVEGGWWEGLLGERIGWFPANHVVDHLVTAEDRDEQMHGLEVTREQVDKLRLQTIMHNNEQEERRKIQAGLETREVERSRIFDTFVAAEKLYADGLRKFIDEFVQPLREASWFPPEHHRAMFGNIHDVLEYEISFSSTVGTSEAGVARAFLHMADRFRDVYTEYCVDLSQAVSMTTQYVTHTQLLEFLQTTSADTSPPVLHLVSSLHKPAHWKNRLQVLMRQLLEATSRDHKEYELLEDACEKLGAILQHIGDVKRIAETREMIRIIEKQIHDWEGPSLASYGDLLLYSNLKLLEGARKRERRFYLFEKLLIIVKPEDHGNMTTSLKLIEKVLIEKSVLINLGDSSEGDASNLSFHLAHQSEDGRVRTLLCTALNPEQKTQWVKAITDLIHKNAHPKGSRDMETSTVVSDLKLENKPIRNLRWLSSWSDKIRRKRPSMPNLREYGRPESHRLKRPKGDYKSISMAHLGAHDREDLVSERGGGLRTKPPLASDLAHETEKSERKSSLPHADQEDGPSHKALKRSASIHRTSDSTRPVMEIQGPSIEGVWGSIGKRRRLASDESEKPSIHTRLHRRNATSSSTASTLRNSAHNSVGDDKASMIVRERLNSHSSEQVTAASSQSSSPASFLWMQSANTSSSFPSQPAIPTRSTSGTFVSSPPDTPIPDGAQEPPEVLAPIAKPMRTSVVQTLEEKAAASPLPKSRTHKRHRRHESQPMVRLDHERPLDDVALKRERSIRRSLPRDFPAAAERDRAYEELMKSMGRHLPEAENNQNRNSKKSSGTFSTSQRQPSPISQSESSVQVPSVVTLPMPTDLGTVSSAGETIEHTDDFPLRRDSSSVREYPVLCTSQVPTLHVRSRSSHTYAESIAPKSRPSLAPYSQGGSRQFPYSLSTSPSTSTLNSMGKSGFQRKSSIANLVTKVRGSIRSLFKTEPAEPVVLPSVVHNTSQSGPYLNSKTRKSSFADLRQLFSKGKGKDTILQANQSTLSVDRHGLRYPAATLPRRALTPVVESSPPKSSANSAARDPRPSKDTENRSPRTSRSLPSLAREWPVQSSTASRIPTPPAGSTVQESVEQQRSIVGGEAPQDGPRGYLDSGVYGLTGRTSGGVENEYVVTEHGTWSYKSGPVRTQRDFLVSERKGDPSTSAEVSPKDMGGGEASTVLADFPKPVAPVPVDHHAPTPMDKNPAEHPTRRESLLVAQAPELATKPSIGEVSFRSGTSWSTATRKLSRRSFPPPYLDSDSSSYASFCKTPPRPIRHNRVLRRVKSNLGTLDPEYSRNLSALVNPGACSQQQQQPEANRVSNEPRGAQVPTKPLPTTTLRAQTDARSTDDEQVDYGPIIGRLDVVPMRVYADLVRKFDAMQAEIQELKDHVKAVEQQMQAAGRSPESIMPGIS